MCYSYSIIFTHYLSVKTLITSYSEHWLLESSYMHCCDVTVEHDCYWLRHLPVKHHEDETGQHQGVVGEGKEGSVLLSFSFSADGDFVRVGKRKRERE